MTILSLLQGDKIEPKRVTAQEMAGACPVCGGADRFRIWPEKGRWWCRGCDKSGDEIAYLREIRGMSFKDSCAFLGKEPVENYRRETPGKSIPTAKTWEPKPDKTPSELWREKAGALVSWAHDQLLKEPSILQWLEIERGITLETVKARRLGWNPSDLYRDRESWGLEPEQKPDGKFKKLWIPAGLVIPTFRGETLLRVRVRRQDPGEGQRYIFLPGGSSGPMALGEDQKFLAVVESELDAILLFQDAGDVVGVVALGSAAIRPDIYTASILSSAENVMVSLDSDDAGAKESWKWWLSNFPNSKRWAIIDGKDPTEAKKNGLPLREWILAGLPEISSIEPSQPHHDSPMGQSIPDPEPNQPRASNEEIRELREERAAIMEFDGGLSREEAERRAALDIPGNEDE